MSKYKKKYKGVRYIAKALTKYQKGKYKSYKKALPDARKYFDSIKKNGKTVKLTNIWELSKKKRTTLKSKEKGKPSIDKNLLDMSFYFELLDYPTWILRCSNNLYFTSNLWPSKLYDIQGGTIVDYDRYFASFVNYVNSMKGLSSPSENRYETDWLVTCTEPIMNVATKRWESKMISVDSDGNIVDYGYDPSTPTKLATKLVSSDIESEKKKSKEETTKTQALPPTQIQSAERVKEIRGLIADLRQDAKDGLISKEDYASAVKDLLSKLEKGGKI